MGKNENIFVEGDLVFSSDAELGREWDFIGRIVQIGVPGACSNACLVQAYLNKTPIFTTLDKLRHATNEERKEFFIRSLQ